MNSIKIAGVGAALLLAAGFVAMVRHGHAQSADASTYEPKNMKDFKKPGGRTCERNCRRSNSRLRSSAARNRRSTMPIGTITNRAFTWTWSRASRCSARWTSLIPARGWPSFAQPLERHGRGREEGLGVGHGAHGGALEDWRIRISAMFSTMGRGRRACATASTPPRLKFIPVEEMDQAGLWPIPGTFRESRPD